MRKFSIKLLFLIIFRVSGLNSELCRGFLCEENDSCNLPSGSRGVVTPRNNCDYARALAKTRRTNELRAIHKGFSGRDVLICCPISVVKCREFGVLLPDVALEPHVIKGTDAEIGEFPFFAALGYETSEKVFGLDYEFKCGGALISEQFVLSAAHCFSMGRPTIVRMGRTSLINTPYENWDPVDRTIMQTFFYPGYHSLSRDFDISLIKLNAPVEIQSIVFPACLPYAYQEIPKKLIVAGFGATEFSTKKGTTHLQKGKVSEVAIRDCKLKFEQTYGNELKFVTKLKTGINEKLLCAKDEKVDTCVGDSGTGLVHNETNNFYVNGIVSFGVGCATQLPSFYTRVSSYLKWIEDIVWP